MGWVDNIHCFGWSNLGVQPMKHNGGCFRQDPMKMSEDSISITASGTEDRENEWMDVA